MKLKGQTRTGRLLIVMKVLAWVPVMKASVCFLITKTISKLNLKKPLWV